MKDLPHKAKTEGLKEEYNAACPVCAKTFKIQPCMGMELGMNMGTIVCNNCNSFLHVKINANNDGMITQRFDDFIKGEMKINV